MSNTKRQDYSDPNDPVNYAPPRLRERAQGLRSEIAQQDDPSLTSDTPETSTQARKQQPHGQLDHLTDAVGRALQDSLEPQPVEPPLHFKDSPKGDSFGLVIRFGAAAALAAVAALVFVVVMPSSRRDGSAPENVSQTATLLQSPKSVAAPASKLSSKLVVRDSSGVVGDALQLGVGVSSTAPGAVVTINGVPAGARLTVGKRINSNEWRVPARDIGNAAVIPPADFAGTVDLSVELSGADGAAEVSSFVRLSWLREPVPSVAPAKSQAALLPPAAPTPAPARAEPAREIDPTEVAGFVRRAQELLANGDLQPARLLLLRAAEAHDSRAAFILARTYDPIVLKQFGATGPQPDLVLARVWYQKAREWGASDAQSPLDALASFDR